MIKLKKKSLIFLVLILILLSFMGCSSKSNTSKVETISLKSSADLKNKKSDVLDYYKKVNLGMSKDQVDSTLTLKPEAETGQMALPNSFKYFNHDTGYGVYVVYNSKNIVYSKSYICGDYSEIAKLCKKPVRENQVPKITDGMDYKDVINILGGEGVEWSITGSEKDSSLIGLGRLWANTDKSYIQVLFSKNDKVTVAQFISKKGY